MGRKSKYRVKVVVANNFGLSSPTTKYLIQKRVSIFGWWDEHDATTQKDWAYKTCEEMNTEYEDIRAKNKSNKK